MSYSCSFWPQFSWFEHIFPQVMYCHLKSHVYRKNHRNVQKNPRNMWNTMRRKSNKGDASKDRNTLSESFYYVIQRPFLWTVERKKKTMRVWLSRYGRSVVKPNDFNFYTRTLINISTRLLFISRIVNRWIYNCKHYTLEGQYLSSFCKI